MSPQSIPALQPLPTAAGLAHEPGFAPARLLVLLAAVGQEEGQKRALEFVPQLGVSACVIGQVRTVCQACGLEH